MFKKVVLCCLLSSAFLMAADGGQPRVLTGDPGLVSRARRASDGHLLMFGRRMTRDARAMVGALGAELMREGVAERLFPGVLPTRLPLLGRGEKSILTGKSSSTSPFFSATMVIFMAVLWGLINVIAEYDPSLFFQIQELLLTMMFLGFRDTCPEETFSLFEKHQEHRMIYRSLYGAIALFGLGCIADELERIRFQKARALAVPVVDFGSRQVSSVLIEYRARRRDTAYRVPLTAEDIRACLAVVQDLLPASLSIEQAVALANRINTEMRRCFESIGLAALNDGDAAIRIGRLLPSQPVDWGGEHVGGAAVPASVVQTLEDVSAGL